MLKMTTALRVGAALAVLVLAPTAWADSDKDCNRPLPPTIPDGRTVDKVDMIKVRQQLKLYKDAGDEFLACLENALETMGSAAREMKTARIEKKKESFTEELKTIGERFNNEVRIYNARFEAPKEEPAPAESPIAAPAPEPAKP